MWVYAISTGKLYRDTELKGEGYSGAGHTLAEGRNNVAMIGVHEKGPTPLGRFRIEPPRDSKTLGPLVMDLTPLPGTETFGRSLFRIHGNNVANDASHGCIILNHTLRLLIANALAAANDNNQDSIIEVRAA